jgi:hypothetical protein
VHAPLPNQPKRLNLRKNALPSVTSVFEDNQSTEATSVHAEITVIPKIAPEFHNYCFKPPEEPTTTKSHLY